MDFCVSGVLFVDTLKTKVSEIDFNGDDFFVWTEASVFLEIGTNPGRQRECVRYGKEIKKDND